MKKCFNVFVSVFLMFLFVGCEGNVPVKSHNLNSNGVVKVGNGYVIAMMIDRGLNEDVIYFPADEQGNILSPNAYPSVYQNGKHTINSGGPLQPAQSDNITTYTSDPVVIIGKKPRPGEPEEKFVFECDTLAECKKDIAIVERSITQLKNQ